MIIKLSTLLLLLRVSRTLSSLIYFLFGYATEIIRGSRGETGDWRLQLMVYNKRVEHELVYTHTLTHTEVCCGSVCGTMISWDIY